MGEKWMVILVVARKLCSEAMEIQNKLPRLSRSLMMMLEKGGFHLIASLDAQYCSMLTEKQMAGREIGCLTLAMVIGSFDNENWNCVHDLWCLGDPL